MDGKTKIDKPEAQSSTSSPLTCGGAWPAPARPASPVRMSFLQLLKASLVSRAFFLLVPLRRVVFTAEPAQTAPFKAVSNKTQSQAFQVTLVNSYLLPLSRNQRSRARPEPGSRNPLGSERSVVQEGPVLKPLTSRPNSGSGRQIAALPPVSWPGRPYHKGFFFSPKLLSSVAFLRGGQRALHGVRSPHGSRLLILQFSAPLSLPLGTCSECLPWNPIGPVAFSNTFITIPIA